MAATPTPGWTQFRDVLWPNPSNRDVRMVIDCARDPRIYGLMLECFYTRHTCLFSGPISPQMQVVAPYILEIEYDDKKTEKFVRETWGGDFGFFLKSDTRSDRLVRHLRSLLIVRDYTNRTLMFRYYDPRILRRYLRTCTVEELRIFYGPVQAFWVESESSDTLLHMEFDQIRLKEKLIPLAPAARGAVTTK
jgi:hypothetical protein